MGAAGYTQLVAAFAILLSVAVRWIRSGASWGAIEDGTATAEHLRDVTGILQPDKLLEAFGPPRLQDGVFSVTQRDALRHRTGLGYLLGDKWLDGGSAVIAVLVLLPLWPIWGTRAWLELFLVFASLYQLAGWFASMAFIGRR
jgi:hypothetical protein